MEPRDEDRWDAVSDAVEALLEGEIDEAQRLLRASIDRDPDNYYAHFHMGVAFAEREQHGFALAAFAEAERRNPGYVGAVHQKGVALLRLGKHRECEAAATRVLDLRHEDPDGLFLLGRCHYEQGNRDEAIDALRRFLAVEKNVEDRFEVEAMLQSLGARARRE